MMLSGGTVLKAAGPKSNSGTFLGLHEVSQETPDKEFTRVRFLSNNKNNPASVLLGTGTIVNFGWDAARNLEIKVRN